MNQHKSIFLVIIVMLCSLGLIATDIYIPAMPHIANYFHTNSQALQSTLSIYLFGLACAQLIYGTLSDRFGRKKIAIIGLIIFTLSTLAAAFSTSITTLIIARLFQAIGAASGMTIGRIIITDIYDKTESAKIFATIFPVIGLSPAISPVIGAVISHFSDWRAVFYFVALFSILLIILMCIFLPETHKNKISIHPVSIMQNYGSLLKQKIFWRYALVPSFAYVVYFAYIAESPFIFNSLHYTTLQIGFFYISISISYFIGNLIARKLLTYLSINQLIYVGYGCFIVGAFLMLAMNTLFAPSSENLIMPATILTLGNGFLLPMGSAGLISQFPKIAGYASGLLGFFQLSAAAISANMIGIITHGNAVILSLVMVAVTVLAATFFILTFLPSPTLRASSPASGRANSS